MTDKNARGFQRGDLVEMVSPYDGQPKSWGDVSAGDVGLVVWAEGKGQTHDFVEIRFFRQPEKPLMTLAWRLRLVQAN